MPVWRTKDNRQLYISQKWKIDGLHYLNRVESKIFFPKKVKKHLQGLNQIIFYLFHQFFQKILSFFKQKRFKIVFIKGHFKYIESPFRFFFQNGGKKSHFKFPWDKTVVNGLTVQENKNSGEKNTMIWSTIPL